VRGNSVASWEGSNPMRVASHRLEAGYSILEALIACSLTMIVAAGVSKLTSVAKSLASRAYIEVTPSCEGPTCSRGIGRVTCICDKEMYTVIP
jgi:hypothetical protein